MSLPPPIFDGDYIYGWSIRHQCRVLVRAPEEPPVAGDRSGAEPAPPPRPPHPLGISMNPAVRRRWNLDGGRCPCGVVMQALEFERALAADGMSVCDACRRRDAPVFPSPSVAAP